MVDFIFDKIPKGADMFDKLIEKEKKLIKSAHEEGELYKIVTTFGKTFELRYGFYEEKDRLNPLCQPAIIYPDFSRNPCFTDDGAPLVTMMQDACNRYAGEVRRTSDTTCAECKYFERGEEWFGICTCPKNKRSNE